MDPLISASRVASSALSAHSTRLRIVAENLANADSTGSTPGSDPYARKLVTYEQVNGKGGSPIVRVRTIERDTRPFTLELRAGHPAADEKGYVKLPNVDPLVEIADLKDANRAYQASLQSIRQVRELVSMTIDLLKG